MDELPRTDSKLFIDLKFYRLFNKILDLEIFLEARAQRDL